MTSEQIKEIRKILSLSQEDFAHTLGTSLGTVNRWENGRNKPSKMAVKLLERMAEDAEQVIQQRIEDSGP